MTNKIWTFEPKIYKERWLETKLETTRRVVDSADGFLGHGGSRSFSLGNLNKINQILIILYWNWIINQILIIL